MIFTTKNSNHWGIKIYDRHGTMVSHLVEFNTETNTGIVVKRNILGKSIVEDGKVQVREKYIPQAKVLLA